ncbi:MAG: hypothetical protein A3F82_08045 [Deltaproteobacteria bacterium RIFCSPLOWO2_12_FULL_44_12]|nr:MAG: hypothetical protein A2712_07225 [Deltaproteobacteria bacterium RIFCSPHIGHO2_01_FULL_43_49]OGQ15737.1 MAG: hypothetical protein A3D22_06015 [Deltaproteobacteria bacterium RIFCSPHIGHO2_02_FULL_44_53]OGQ28706.1 MAG: hypothetical protein A3D98_00750 [Deltaproteobacteria bacterium RIFCSPHIGHO2_12_FULL_44_21]OGQ32029.1 MAG: hypothetical protein A2979_02960 [Deltaproteobacteria bacterium RIFCSPLOWO2_01_FULL_45_74]OGQ43689.1 MAG: hypothetical protein A3I70_03475 [Deltaproteobacteria bacterium 
MEERDLELIKQVSAKENALENLYKEHVSYERQLAKLDRKLFLTPEEVVLRKELQKKKLKGKDQIETILKKYRGEATSH